MAAKCLKVSLFKALFRLLLGTTLSAKTFYALGTLLLAFTDIMGVCLGKTFLTWKTLGNELDLVGRSKPILLIYFL
jgi:hypothetical protein